MLKSCAFVTVAVLLAAGCASARAGEPKPEQQAVVEELAPLAVQYKAVYDEDGNVVKFAFSNHGAFWKDEEKEPPGGLDDETFKKILTFEKLEAIALEKQKISDESYASLAQLKGLRDVRLHYMDREAGATPDAPMFINKLPLPLEVLEIKHNFSIRGGCMAKLKALPELKKLEIDTGYAGRDAVGFIKGSPKLVNLQMHRTTMTDADLQEVFAALPDLEVLLVRPSGQKRIEDRITGRSLRGLENNKKLRLLILGLEWGELPYEGGLDILATLPKLEKVDIRPSDIKNLSVDDPAIRRLHEARPDIEIRTSKGTIGGVEGRQTGREDDAWNWDGGVTTHG